MTFFSEVKTKFLTIAEGEDIPTENFLLSCSEIVPFFGKYKFRCFFMSAVVSMSVVLFCRYVGPYCVQASEIRCQWKYRGNC